MLKGMLWLIRKYCIYVFRQWTLVRQVSNAFRKMLVVFYQRQNSRLVLSGPTKCKN